MNWKLGLLIGISLFFASSLAAQPTPPTPADVPIDGGIGFLTAAAVAFGARKLKQRQANNAASNQHD
jgi:hypothetical protein